MSTRSSSSQWSTCRSTAASTAAARSWYSASEKVEALMVGTLRGMPYRAASSVVAPCRRLWSRVLVLAVSGAAGAALLAACGQRGPLTLPGAEPASSPTRARPTTPALAPRAASAADSSTPSAPAPAR
ncbi:MAG: lipoprotein [Burkholderiaceae bacterium]